MRNKSFRDADGVEFEVNHIEYGGVKNSNRMWMYGRCLVKAVLEVVVLYVGADLPRAIQV